VSTVSYRPRSRAIPNVITIASREVRRCLSHLTELQRESVLLAYYQGYTCRQEVAELQATAGRVGAAVAAEPPSTLAERVFAEVARTPRLPPETRRWSPQRRSPRCSRRRTSARRTPGPRSAAAPCSSPPSRTG
jgi:hypothetical protein